ncbi:MAG: ImmA/IrrE family metallo-endopeptidase [Haliscomenobacteraceae bacterium CHB4]|nr:hypothetical protein [Saprospiraceae bacterium]MCE7925058.1 ImmA/IrrE family metallo-endopeptidase [Haliscomenobacteraceae bacterium CHB4]
MSKTTEFRTQINPALLVWARETIGFSRAEAARRSGLEERYLDRVESGRQYLLYDELVKLAKIYKRSVATLMQTEPPHEAPLPADYRTTGSGKVEPLTPGTISAIRKARRLALGALELRQALGQERAIFPSNLSADQNEHAETVATRVREMLPFDFLYKNLTAEERFALTAELLESKGVLVFRLGSMQDDVRGFCLTDTPMPVIAVKKYDEAVARLFTLFHELGHVLLRTGGICNLDESPRAFGIEVWCNRFAGAMLLPFDRLTGHPEVLEQKASGQPQWDNQNLGKLARAFGVSRFVVLRRLVAAGLASPAFYQKMHEQWTSKQKTGGFGGTGKPDLVKRSLQERGEHYANMALRALDTQKISLWEAADLLDIRVDQIGKIRDYLSAPTIS